MTAHEIAARIAERAAWRYSRASGPGGQRRDHAQTRAELTVTPADLEGLPEPVARRIGARLDIERRPLRLISQAERSRERNRDAVVERLARRVAGALAPAPPPRRPTRPSRAARERRLADKARRAGIKAGRRSRPDQE
jgi:ribosome-associated protein